MKHIIDIGMQPVDHTNCHICPQAKQKRLKFPDSLYKSSVIFQLIHADEWGPYRTPTYDRKYYFVTIVYDYSRFTWACLISSKAEVFSVLKNFLLMVNTQFGVKVKVLRSDNDTEFMNINCKELFDSLGIVHQTSCAYTPQQNGVVERKHGHILNTARALRLQSNVPIKYWGHCVKTAVYLINKIPSAVLNGKSPHEMLYGITPQLTHLRVFGCLCFTSVLPRSDKFAARAKKGVLLGYAETQKGYRVLDLEFNSIHISRDITFEEKCFPFKSDKVAETSIPSAPDSYNCNEDHPLTIQAIPADYDPSNVSSPSEVENNIIMPDSEDIFLGDEECTNADISPPIPPIVVTSNNPIARPNRSVKPPIWHKDYLMSTTSKQAHNTCLYPISDYVDYSNLNGSYKVFLTSLSNVDEPHTFKEASTSPHWVHAMQEEIAALELNKTWSIVNLPPGKQAIGSKWVYKIKLKATCEVERYKARLVAKGYHQQAGLDYHETFAPVAKMVTVKTVISVAASHNWPLYQMDVHNAFLQGDLNEEVYMEIPQGFRRKGEQKVCKLLKSLYGLKQASRQWNIKLTEVLLDTGFTQSSHDHSLFTKSNGHDIAVILIYVDDLLLTGNSHQLIQELKDSLHSRFKMKNLGDLKYFLGIEILRSKTGILLNQRKYALELISDTGLSGAKPANTPLEANIKLTTVEHDELLGVTDDSVLKDVTSYQRLVGRLLYLTITRPDISFAVQVLSQFMQQPKVSHWEEALRLVRYIKRSPGQGILLSSKRCLQLEAFCDADWVACSKTRRSVTGYMVKLGDSLIS